MRKGATQFIAAEDASIGKALPAGRRRKSQAGRPRSERTRKAILKAALRLLKQACFDAVSAQQIAVEAGVSTATLYRWWDNKQAIVLDAYLETMVDLLPRSRRGSPLERLRKYTLRVGEFLKSEDGRLFLRLLLAIREDPALHQAFYQRIFLPRRLEGCKVVEEAVEAGELPYGTNPDLIISLLVGPQIVRAMMGQELSASFAQTLFDFVVRPCPPALKGKAGGRKARTK